jgi:transcriptional regulator with XRE-family HTH domain
MIGRRAPPVDYAGGNGGAAAAHYDARMNTAASLPRSAPPPFGEHLRHWRQRRRLSQLELAQEAAISARHLSFVETGRSVPSREMVLRLAQRLDVPLRERNALLVAAGYAPMYRERPLDDPALAAARQAVDLILKSHEPYPALAVDRHWNLLAANAMLPHLMAGADPQLLQGRVNVLRLSLHPQGLAPKIVNLGQWRHHLFERLRQQIQATGDAVLAALLEELSAYPVPPDAGDTRLEGELLGVAMPFRFMTQHGVLNFISTTTVFGTPADITLQELALETFFPADPRTAEVMRQLMASGPPAAP